MSFKHKKKYGQNFLTDQNNILDMIIEVSNPCENEEILEIGPGEGALTELLLKKSKRVNCVEIDTDLEKLLKAKFENEKKFNLIMGDILEVDLNEVLVSNTKVIANIPYYITSPIVNKLISHRDKINEIYLMVQKEVGERICATSGKERSILTLAVEFFGKGEYLFTIPKESFTPIPKVDSGFISIKLHKDKKYENEISEELFFKYVKASFSNKRKNIVNNLSTLHFSKDFIKEKLEILGISPNERAENITIDKFIELANLFENK
ncbi:16S rRNA (adenine(1518)-N(6)/adenine(1519)-N(6))-dimethyltransferase RsmA [Fusobacterium sp. IOR10]|uniref:16S rRNA (adenine(1518)-N(6)/adenine(1519)-N(6))- dimethyltransferase RsmA n=1 Tax=Fusobacterium sp. IOR10 TaxID=2665157 RepID=UPI0013D58BC0|nr:16S rRNA (adenine(1518)-N(6)/adenine(1519)-N(6))-dimethyltransferase RsmA [Fusobacterium sp. IOR10]